MPARLTHLTAPPNNGLHNVLDSVIQAAIRDKKLRSKS